MVAEKITEILRERFGEAIGEGKFNGAHPHVLVSAGAWPEVAKFLRDDPRMGFNMLRCVSGLDLLAENQLAAVYDLVAMRPASQSSPTPAAGRGIDASFWTCTHEFAVRIVTDRDDPHIPSVAHVWPTADWHEREAYDLLGIRFDGHPDSVEDHDGLHPRRILCPDDWVGHALRKDYEFPTEYHGIPGTTEYELASPKH